MDIWLLNWKLGLALRVPLQHSSLQFTRRTRYGVGPSTAREYLDFVVDRRSLLDMLGGLDLAGCFGWGEAEEQQRAAEQLLLRSPSELSPGRVPLYVCPECGDLECGAVTVHVERTNDSFVWSDFAMEGGPDSPPTRYSKWQSLGPFAFNKTEYWHVLQTARTGHPAA